MIDRYASGKRKIDYTCDGISVDSSCKLIIGGLLEPDPSRRLGAAAIKRHDWFENLDWGALFDKSIPAPWKPIVRSAEDTSNFESEEYGADNAPRRPYKGDPEWFAGAKLPFCYLLRSTNTDIRLSLGRFLTPPK